MTQRDYNNLIREESMGHNMKYMDPILKQNESFNDDFYTHVGNNIDMKTHQILNRTTQNINLDAE